MPSTFLLAPFADRVAARPHRYLDTLRSDLEHARVQWPSRATMQHYADVISAWEPGLWGMFGLVYG